MIRMLLRVLGRHHARPVRRAVALMTAASIAEGVSYALLLPILRTLLGSTPADAWPWLFTFAAAVACFAVLRFAADRNGFRAATTLLRGMYHRLGEHLVRLPIGWFRTSKVGELSKLSSRGVLEVMSVIAHLLGPLISAIVTPLTIVVVMLAVHWQMGLAALAAVPVVVAVQRLGVRSMTAADAERVERDHEAAGRVIEHLQAQPVLRAGGRSAERFDLLDKALRDLERASRRSVLSALPGMVGLGLTVQAAFTALLALGAYLVLAGSAGPAETVTLLVLAARCADPLLSLVDLGGKVQAARTGLAKLDAVLRIEPLPEPDEPVQPFRHDLNLDSVTFHHGGRKVIDDVSLNLPPGRRLAIVGPSGAGKSTLLHLLARSHDVDSGAVRWGGVDVRSIDVESLTNMVSIVFQDVYLFNGTIEENVRLGRPEADDAAVRAAASAAGLAEVIERLPDGWETAVGEGGALLSGGERQRVSIARAMLKDAPVLLLDEITSSLDAVTATEVHAGIERLMAGRTVVTVTHRLRTVQNVDHVAFLDGGRLVEQGTHNELVRRGGRYAEFWRASMTAVPG